MDRYNLSRFDATDMIRLRGALRNLKPAGGSMESVSREVVDYLFRSLQDSEENPASVLVRIFKTHPYAGLEPSLRAYADALMPRENISPRTRCLTLLASRGVEEAWNSREGSQGHRAIPLLSESMVSKAPMIARLIEQMGIPLRVVLNPDRDFVLNAQEKTFNVFHIEHAAGSPYIPAQETFVLPYGVRSVLGFGGLLPSGDLFVTIVFARVPIPLTTAKLFAPLSLTVKLSLLPFDGGRVFDGVS